MMNKQREHFSSVIILLVQQLSNYILPVLGFSFLSNEIETSSIFFFFIIFSDITASLQWYFKTFEIQNQNFYFNTGIINLKKQSFQLKAIKSVDTKQSFLARILHLKTIIIDTGITDNTEEIQITLSFQKADMIRNHLLVYIEKPADECKENVKKESNTFALMQYALVKEYTFSNISLYFIFFIPLFVGTEFLYRDLLPPILYSIPIVASYLMLVFYRFSIFYNFQVEIQNNDFNTQRGLFSRNTSNIKSSEMNSIIVTQSFLQKLCRKASIRANTISLEFMNANGSYLCLNIDDSQVSTFIKEYLPQFVFDEPVARLNKKHKLNYHYARLGYNNDLLFIQEGFLRRRQHYILSKDVNYIQKHQNLLHKMRNTIAIVLHIKGSTKFSIVGVSGYDPHHYDPLVDIISNPNIK